MVDMLPQVGNGIYKVILNDVLSRIIPYNPPIFTGHRLQEVQSNAVIVTDVNTGEQKTIPADHVVLALGVSPDKMQAERYKAVCPRVLTVGDASQGGRITEAMHEGFARAYVL
jgi:NADPH-dependent 2,4-dienoyl-CoA reductase/sulfur reductase-like enzyme